ncbi:MAG: hypothetical protein IT405_00360 [Candidatus Yanofskybacteria bacterium]|nr:hypothetical protein [Candidatus Yanofskybacteria bacterium]
MPRGTRLTDPPQKPHFLVVVCLFLLIAGFFVLAIRSSQRKNAAVVAAPPASAAPVEVPSAPGSYFFPATGDAWIVARHTFEAAHPELACEYSGAREGLSRFIDGHYLVCRNIAVDAESVTIP